MFHQKQAGRNVIDILRASTQFVVYLDAYPEKQTGNENQQWGFARFRGIGLLFHSKYAGRQHDHHDSFGIRGTTYHSKPGYY